MKDAVVHLRSTGVARKSGGRIGLFACVPVVALQDWPRTDLLTYAALASWPPGSTPSIAEIRECARIRNQELLLSLDRLERCGEVKRKRRRGTRSSYEVTPPPRQWARVPVAVLRDQELNRAAVLVYMALESFANPQREAWPGVAMLKDRAGVSRRTVYTARDALSKQHIHWYRGRRQEMKHHTIYVLRPKPKQDVRRVVLSREDVQTSMYRAAMRGEDPPKIPEQFVDVVEQQIDPARRWLERAG